MRIKALIAAFALTASAAMAQKGVEDGSRFGHGQDSIDCLNNISLYSENLKTKNYTDAYTYWQKVFADAPISRHSLYTDGVTEATNANSDLYGEKQLLAILDENAGGDPQAICDAVKRDVDAFVAEAPQFDDITMLSIVYNGSQEMPGKETR